MPRLPPALGVHRASELAATVNDSLGSKCGRAILPACAKGVPHFKVLGKGGKTRYVPLHPGTQVLIHEYLNAAGHGPPPLR